MPGRSADRHRPAAQFRRRSTDSPAVTATGTMFCAASISGTSSSAARRQQALISAPVKSRSLGCRWAGSSPNLSRYSRQISSFSRDPGRSRKKIASNRSARVNSGGSFETSLAEQTKKTSLSWSLS